jgi:hypothetical protein
MRNQSVKNPKVFPASTATLGDTLRDSECLYIYTRSVVRASQRDRERVSEREPTNKTHALWIRRPRDTSRLARNPSARCRRRDTSAFLPQILKHTHAHTHIHPQIICIMSIYITTRLDATDL